MENLLALGVEFGSTRIKAVLTDGGARVIAQGAYEWENKFENGIWTYPYELIITGLQTCYSRLKSDYKARTGSTLTRLGAVGISAMMHGFIALDKGGNPLAPFKTWRCGDAEREAKELTKLFNFPVPARWTAAHLYKAVKDGEKYLPQIHTVTTLAGFVHYLLTGKSVLGVGDASGVFPVDKSDYDRKLIEKFDELAGGKLSKSVYGIFPRVLLAGQCAGNLTEKGALLLDREGDLESGAPFCPPEGDAGTGMVATNSVKPLTGNVSAGTSVFSMAVLDRPLSAVYEGVDIVTTPAGAPVAMVHCNNCSSEINAWAGLFAEACGSDKNELYKKLFELSLNGDADCGGIVACNYTSGENITGVEKGTPFVARTAESNFSLANFIRAQLYSAFATLKIGNDNFVQKEKIKIEKYYAHGGLFKTEGICQKYLAAALNTPVAVMTTAGEGGAWGMAVLAGYALNSDIPLEQYLESKIFADCAQTTVYPDAETVKGFNAYTEKFKEAIKAEEVLKNA